MQKSLPKGSSLEDVKNEVRELVKGHREKNPAAFALLREFDAGLAEFEDEELWLYPLGSTEAQSIIAHQYGFPSWSRLADQLGGSDRIQPEQSIVAKFRTICEARAKKDYLLYSSVMNDSVRSGISKDDFISGSEVLAGYFRADYTSTYLGELMERDQVVYFWKITAPGQKTDLLVRMRVKDDFVTGILFSAPLTKVQKSNRGILG